MRFESKIDTTYKVVIWLGPVILLPLLILEFSITRVSIILCSVLLSWWILNSVSYTINGNELFIKCFVLRKKQKISEIESVKKVNNILSSYALSKDRLEIKTKNDKFYISPLREDEFISLIKKINKKISF